MPGSKEIISNIDRAASLPQNAPHILVVDPSIRFDEAVGEPAAVIDIGDFEDALRCPKVAAFRAGALAYRETLLAEGRDHTGTEEI